MLFRPHPHLSKMARTSSCAVMLAPGRLCILFVIYVFLLEIFVNPSRGTLVYRREQILDIGLQSVQTVQSVEKSGYLPLEVVRRDQTKQQPRKRARGKRGGVKHNLRARADRPPLPSLLLANVQSLNDNKVMSKWQ